MGLVVAVDGPAGVGKSTVSRLVAERLEIAHLDTGAFYRAATLLALGAGAGPTDSDAVTAAVAGRVITQADGRTEVDTVDVTDQLRSPEVTEWVSTVAAHPRLRAAMVEAQRAWVDRAGGAAVVEGRDIGTVVFPEAPVKVFLDAHPEVRAGRRATETGSSPSDALEALTKRDRTDSNRAASPLMVADDAVVLDTSHLSAVEVAERVVQLVEASA